MCGIAGIVGRPGEPPSREALSAMASALAHRGPDEQTTTLYPGAGFAFRRLSIIDVAGGAQPLDGEDGSCHLILNGEIYNHAELRPELETAGHRFRTRSDAEVVVHGYEQWGDAVVERLRGMFAFALWDERRQRLLLARDRLGKKPLVYHEAEGRLQFASELQGLLADPALPRQPDLAALHHYLTYQYVPAPWTAFQGVRKLPPAHLLVFEDGRASVRRYWSLSSRPPLRLSEEDAAAEVRRLLRDAVRVRLMSEVPLGAFLSGGVDSSAVVALMSEFGRVKTFSIGFEEESFDERRWAAMVARRYGTEHHEFVVRPQASEVLPALVEHYGEPFADSSALPTYYLSRLTREHVTVALNGDGGDELFAGYDRYGLLSAYRLLGRVPHAAAAASATARAWGRRLPASVRRLLGAISARPEESYARTVSYFSPEEKDALYTPWMREQTRTDDSLGLLESAFAQADAPDLLGRTLQVDLATYLPGDLLVKVDIATMAVGLEGRSPFLDHPLVEFAARLPTSLKRRRGRGKWLLRRAVADLLPPEILARRKMGFGVPVSRWFRGELRNLLHDVVLSERAQQRGMLDGAAVAGLVDQHERGAADHGHRLWALLFLELWFRRFIDTPPAAAPAA
jgi:asparagine synthase (glutamine-hydrolysing)